MYRNAILIKRGLRVMNFSELVMYLITLLENLMHLVCLIDLECSDLLKYVSLLQFHIRALYERSHRSRFEPFNCEPTIC